MVCGGSPTPPDTWARPANVGQVVWLRSVLTVELRQFPSRILVIETVSDCRPKGQGRREQSKTKNQHAALSPRHSAAAMCGEGTRFGLNRYPRLLARKLDPVEPEYAMLSARFAVRLDVTRSVTCNPE